MITLIDRYIITSILTTTLVVLLVLLSLYGFLAFVEALGDIGRGDFNLYHAALYTLFTLPRRAYELFPFVVLLGTMLGLGQLSNHSEMVAIRAAGYSVLRVAWAAMKAGVVLLIFMLLLGEYLVPNTEGKAQQLRTQAINQQLVINADNEIWVRDRETYISVRSVLPDKSLQGITIYQFNQDKELESVSFAKDGFYNGEQWLLKEIQQSFISKSRIRQNYLEHALWPTLLDPELLNVMVSELDSLSMRGLYRYMNYLDDNNLDSSRYQLSFWNKLVAPFSMAAMLLLAIPFVFTQQRAVNTGARLLIGILVGIGFTMANQITSQLGVVYQVPAALSASFITIVTLTLTLFALRRIR